MYKPKSAKIKNCSMCLEHSLHGNNTRTSSNLIRVDGPDLMDVHATFVDTIWISKLIKEK